jgi:Ca-activated chloride channel homolog
MNPLPLKILFLNAVPIIFTILSFSSERRIMDPRASGAAKASQSEVSKPPLIQVQSNLIRVPVSVTDASGNPVVNLELKDFRIEEDGESIALASVAKPGIAPLELALIMDVSASVQPRFEFEVLAATKFLNRILKPGDDVIILAIGSHPHIIQVRTNNFAEALGDLKTIVSTRESTALYDTLVMAANMLLHAPSIESRRVQVVLSDGEDNNSELYKFEDALHEIQREDCILYAINPAGPSIELNKISTEGQSALQSLAVETGGTAFLPGDPEELEAIFDRIAKELDTQYLLEYYSIRRGDGSFRKITVKVPGRPGLRIRSRQGYYSANEIQSRPTRRAETSIGK